jgi:hypothetical protein
MHNSEEVCDLNNFYWFYTLCNINTNSYFIIHFNINASKKLKNIPNILR